MARCHRGGCFYRGDEQDASSVEWFAVFVGNLFVDRPGKEIMPHLPRRRKSSTSRSIFEWNPLTMILSKVLAYQFFFCSVMLIYKFNDV